ncbi:MAG: hypothetical protein ACFBRM_04750 [Pikeienuella sp.]
MSGASVLDAQSAAAAVGPRAALDAALLAAHETGDEAVLAALYARAAREVAADPAAEAFFLTQAYVYALCAGVAEAGALHTRLKALGREE